MNEATPPQDPYAAPSATLQDTAVDAAANASFYVVSAVKFWLLYLATFGLYGVFWMYSHWAAHKRATRGDEWPVARAIFMIFFVHSLANLVDAALRRTGARHDWAPNVVATFAVLAMIALRLIDRLPATVMSDETAFVLTLLVLPVLGLLLWLIQRAANIACGDPAGAGNARLTVGNWAWLLLGGVLWLLVLAGLLLPAEPLV
jgi:hypothetical protein